MRRPRAGRAAVLCAAAWFAGAATAHALPIGSIAERLLREKTRAVFGDLVSFDTVVVSALRGEASIAGLALRQPPGFGDGFFMKAAAVRTRFAVRPLFRRELVLEDIVVESPEIAFVQKTGGRDNLSALLAVVKHASRPEPGKSFATRLTRFSARNAAISITAPAMSPLRPMLLLRPVTVELMEVRIPNAEAVPTPFTVEATVAAPHPVSLASSGEGVFFTDPVRFTANTLVRNVVLPDFVRLYPGAPVLPRAGTASFMSEAVCSGTLLTSRNRLEIAGLRIGTVRGGPLVGSWLGLPAAAFARFLENERGTVVLDVPVSGPFSTLKADLKSALGEAVSRAARTKLASPVAEAGRRAAQAIRDTAERGIIRRR